MSVSQGKTDQVSWIQRWLPGVSAFSSGYNRQDLKGDTVSAVIISLVTIPSAVAYADLAGTTPIAGLYAALAGLLIYALFGSSRHVICGPDSSVALVAGSIVIPLAAGDPDKAFTLAAWVAIATGGYLLLAARIRVGAIADFISVPVLVGYIHGAVIVLIMSQLGRITGVGLEEENTLFRLYEWFTKLPEAHLPTLILSGVCLAILSLFKLFPKIPGVLVLFVLALAAGQFIDFGTWKIEVFGAMESAMPKMVSLDLAPDQLGEVAIGALGLAILIFSDSMVAARYVAERRGYDVDPNQELAALGASNVASGGLLGFSIGASASRTLLNHIIGGRTQLASLLAAGFLVAFSFLALQWFSNLPRVVSAAILVYAGFSLIDFARIREIASLDRQALLLILMTFCGVLLFGVLPGILIGVVLSLISTLAKLARPDDAVMGRLAGSDILHEVGEDPRIETLDGLIIYRFYGPLLFANVRYFTQRINELISRQTSEVRQIIIDAKPISGIDLTAAEQLSSYIDTLHARGIGFTAARVHKPLTKDADRLRFLTDYEEFPTVRDAVKAFEDGRLKPAGSTTPPQ